MSDYINHETFCVGCLESVKIKHIEQITEGIKHISFGKLLTKQGHLYHHHAIVTDVDQSTENVTLFEFGGTFQCTSDSGAKLRKKILTFNDLKRKNTYLRVYRTSFCADEMKRERINQLLTEDNSRYTVTSNNCEHLAMYVMTGLNVCWQKQDFFSQLRSYCGVPNGVKNVLSWMKKIENFPQVKECFEKFLDCFREIITSVITDVLYDALVGGIHKLYKIVKMLRLKYFIGVGVLLYLCHDIYIQIKEMMEWNKKGYLCEICHRKRVLKLVFRVLLGITSLVLIFVPGPAGTIFSIGILGFDFIISPICKALGENVFFPSFDVPKWPITSLNNLRAGDIITMKYWGLPHELVVAGVLPRSITLTVVTFKQNRDGGLPWLLLEKITLPICEKKWGERTMLKYDYSSLITTNTSLETLDNMQRRLTNKSNGANQYETIELVNELHGIDNSFEPPKVLTPLLKLKEGDVIEFHASDCARTGIVVDVQVCAQQGNMGCIKCIHYALPTFFGTRTIAEEIVEVDITTDIIKHHDYSGHVTHSPEDTVARAQSRLGEQNFNTFNNRSSHLAKYCKLKDMKRDMEIHQSETTKTKGAENAEEVLERIISTDERDDADFEKEIRHFRSNARFLVAS